MSQLRRTSALIALASLTLAFGCKGDTGEETEETGTPEVDDCDPDPCMNEGVCTDIGDTFECDCPDEWTGDTCEEAVIPDPTFFGTLNFDTWEDDAVLCDAVIDLTGWDYTGDCNGCDFAFEIDSTVTEDNGTADCYLFWGLTFQPGGARIPTHLGKWTTYNGTYGSYDNVVATGFAVDYTAYGYGYYPGPYWWFISYDGHPYGTATVGTDSMSWSWDYAAPQYSEAEWYYYNTYYTTTGCDTATRSEITSPSGGNWEQVNTIRCYDPTDPTDVTATDVFSVDLSAGDEISVTVDTVAEDTKLLTWAWVNGVDECTEVLAGDSYACTHPLDYGCPTLDYTATTDGTYTIVVYEDTTYPCTGETGEYNLILDLPEGVEVTQVADDKPATHAELEYTFYLESDASATF